MDRSLYLMIANPKLRFRIQGNRFRSFNDQFLCWDRWIAVFLLVKQPFTDQVDSRSQFRECQLRVFCRNLIDSFLIWELFAAEAQ